MFASFYPNGGWEDFHGFFETFEEAKAYWHSHKEKYEFDFCNIVNMNNFELVYKGSVDDKDE